MLRRLLLLSIELELEPVGRQREVRGREVEESEGLSIAAVQARNHAKPSKGVQEIKKSAWGRIFG